MIRVLLNSIEKVKNFVDIVSRFDTDVFLRVGKNEVDAKSTLGIFSLNLMEPMEVLFDDGKNSEKYIQQIKQYTI